MRWGTEQVETSYRGRPGLQDVDLGIESGSVSTVVGGDGAGKSTLARVMLGLVLPTAGIVRRPQPSQVGYQSEHSGVWPDLTVAENLAFVGGAHRLSGPDLRARIDELLTFTQLGPARDRLATQLSGGMRQKLGIAMALLPRPPLVVLDEPTTGLDPVSRVDIWRMIGSAAADGAGVMVNTTYVDEAERGARVLALEAGFMLAHGTVSEVRSTLHGEFADADRPETERHSWRRGRVWRTWYPDGAPEGVEPVEPDLSDLLIVAAIRRREEHGRG